MTGAGAGIKQSQVCMCHMEVALCVGKDKKLKNNFFKKVDLGLS